MHRVEIKKCPDTLLIPSVLSWLIVYACIIYVVGRQLGHASTDHIPRELRIMGRTIQTDKEVTKWYDLPLTEEEIERGNTLGTS